MSRKHLSVLAVALVVVVGVIFLLLPGRTGEENLRSEAPLLEGLEARVNDVTRLTAVGAGETVIATLERSEAGWFVAELAGYAADMDVLRAVLGGLARAEVVEAKTDNPDLHARLGVEDVSAADAGGIRLDLATADGASWSVIVGNEAPARGGHYLREPDRAGSVLADFEADVPTDAAGWADTAVVDLVAGEVAQVKLERPGGETLTARKISADETDFTLAELPEGREPKSAWAINSLGSALSTLAFEDVQAEDALAWDEAIAFQAVRFDGLEVTGELLRLGEEGDWLRLRARAPEGAQGDTAAEEQDGTVEEDGADAPGDAMAEVADAAREINERVVGWAYRIPAFKAEAMDKRLEDLLKPPPDATETS